MNYIDTDTIAGQSEPAILVIDKRLTSGTANKAAEALTGTMPDALLQAAKSSTSLRRAVPVVMGQSRRVRASIEVPGKGEFWGTVARIDAQSVKMTLDTTEASDLLLPLQPVRPGELRRGEPSASDIGILDQLVGDAAGNEAELADLLDALPADLRPRLKAVLDRVSSFEARIDYVLTSQDGPGLSRRARLDMGHIFDRVVSARFGAGARIDRPRQLAAMAGNPLLTRRLLRQGLHFLIPEAGQSPDTLRVIQQRMEN
ncbi:MAG: hypothetical protein GWM87_09245, partial [Xanthomonadales bacterium]|nr:hypothetical protein [Xanthomonadales bacterium]NIX13094.1 hypothetical protein [Xanthomonadales bacterium]